MFRQTLIPTVAALVAGTVFSQQAPDSADLTAREAPRALRMGVVPIHTGAPDPLLGEYGTWAAADGYKISFHGDATFIPYLGADYPRTQSLSWRTESVTVGGRPLKDSGAVARRHHTATRYEYRFGAITEAYDVREDGVEQSFVIHERPSVRGDLVVVGRIKTGLRGTPQRDMHGGVTFRDDQGQSILRYGEAWALDASQRRADILTTYQGDTITLTVPERWLDDASYPVVIDPLLSSKRLAANLLTDSIDIARVGSPTNHRFVVYCQAASATDWDVLAGAFLDDWTELGNVFQDLGNWTTPHARGAVRSYSFGSKFCMVYNREDLVLGDSHLVFHSRDASDTTHQSALNVVTHTPPPGRHHWRPVIGGLTNFRASLSCEFAVAYQSEPSGASLANTTDSEVHVLMFDAATTPATVGTPFQIPPVGGGDMDQERPSINDAAVPVIGPATWVLAWQEYDNDGHGSEDWDVHARQLDQFGNVSADYFTSRNDGNNQHKLGPKVAGQDGRYCLVYSQAPRPLMPLKPQGIGGMTMTTERFDWADGAATISQRSPNNLVPAEVDPRYEIGGFGYDYESRSHWALTFLSDSATGGDGIVRVARVGYRGRETERRRVGVPATATEMGRPGGVIYDSDNDEFVIGWAIGDPSAGFSTGHGYVTGFTYVQPNPWTTTVAESCSLASISLSGDKPQQIGSQFVAVDVTGAAPNATHLLFVSGSAANIPLPGGPGSIFSAGCKALVALPPAATVILPAVGANPSWSFSLSESFPPVTIYFQDWHDQPALQKIFTTERLEVELVK